MLCEHISKIKTALRSSTPALVMCDVRRAAEDYAVVYLGASIFKITRLLLVAVSSVHFFACIFFKVKGFPYSPNFALKSLGQHCPLE